MTKNFIKIAPATEFFVHSKSSKGISQAFDPSIIIIWILHRLVGLNMLSEGLSPTIFNVRVANFTIRTLDSL